MDNLFVILKNYHRQKIDNNIDFAVIVGNKNFDHSPLIIAVRLGLILHHQGSMEDFFGNIIDGALLDLLHEDSLVAQK